MLWCFQVCIIKEEWLSGQVKETVMTSCNIDDITSVEVDPLLPLYYIIVSVYCRAVVTLWDTPSDLIGCIYEVYSAGSLHNLDCGLDYDSYNIRKLKKDPWVVWY